MKSPDLSRISKSLPISRLRAAEALSVWDGQYDPTHELDTARVLILQALTLRLRLETEKQTSVLH